jgi:hypothetical protein
MEDNKQKPSPATLWVTAIKQLDDEFVEVTAHCGFGSKYYLKASFGIEATKSLRIGTKLVLDIG